MEIIITFIIIGITGYTCFYFGKMQKPTEKKMTKREEYEQLMKNQEYAEKIKQAKIDKSFQELFNYNETIATRGYKDE